MSKSAKTTTNLSHEEFTLRAIHRLREKDYKGIDPVRSGFNAAFQKAFGSDPVAATKQLEAAGKIVIRPYRRGGVLLFDAREEGVKPPPKSEDVLKKILG